MPLPSAIAAVWPDTLLFALVLWCSTADDAEYDRASRGCVDPCVWRRDDCGVLKPPTEACDCSGGGGGGGDDTAP